MKTAAGHGGGAPLQDLALQLVLQLARRAHKGRRTCSSGAVLRRGGAVGALLHVMRANIRSAGVVALCLQCLVALRGGGGADTKETLDALRATAAAAASNRGCAKFLV